MSDSSKQKLPAGAPDEPLTDHDYDGIQEYDNPLPGWWKWIFVASIVITPPYFFFYHNGAEGRSLADRYDRELAANLQLQFAEIGELKPDRENVVKFLYKKSWLQVGKIVFKANCVSCHGKEGGGLVGPNLCDDQYKNVNDIGDILTVLEKGANAGAMPAWKNRLSTNEMVLVASYVASLRGTNPAVAKDGEGRIIPPWPEEPPEEAPAEQKLGEQKPPEEATAEQQPAKQAEPAANNRDAAESQPPKQE